MQRLAAILCSAALLGACTTGRPSSPGQAQPAIAGDMLPVLPAADRVRLAEAFHLAAAVGDRVWAGWSEAPFAVLLVTPEHEFLLRHPRPSSDFVRLGYDSLLATEVFVRSRVFPPTLLATFPAIGAVPTIVVGQPVNTNQTSTRWVLTILHEHFHQLQTSQPDYYPGVAALGLARGDITGMWMLNYPFPYDAAPVQARFAAFTHSLDSALTPLSATAPEHTALAREPLAPAVTDARRHLRAALSAEDDRYLAFQMWQEGVALYTELQIARLAAAPGYAPNDAFLALPDFSEYAAAAAAIEHGIRSGLRDTELGRAKRVVFYPAGAATALLLDAASPGWRARYFTERFSLEPLLP
jgi:hypothetical protein